MGVNFILSQTSPGAKALIIGTDISPLQLQIIMDVCTDGFAKINPGFRTGDDHFNLIPFLYLR
jgi:polyketide biosynthesis 3-hydroxy-3-methylglutaryl-CoA synthase-like enzyme PksG